MTKTIRVLVAGLVAVVALSAGAAEQTVMTGATGGGRNTAVCVTFAAAIAVPTTPLAGRKEILIQNLGPNAIFCTVDGQAPLTTGALGHRLEAASATASTTLRLQAGPKVAVKCIAAVAIQASPACTQITELR